MTVDATIQAVYASVITETPPPPPPISTIPSTKPSQVPPAPPPPAPVEQATPASPIYVPPPPRPITPEFEQSEEVQTVPLTCEYSQSSSCLNMSLGFVLNSNI